METKVGDKDFIENRTLKYLVPTLIEYGPVFKDKLNSVYKIAVGLGDLIIKEPKESLEYRVFILLKSTVATEYFVNFLDWIREQDYYRDDYVYGDIQKTEYHMVVIAFPETVTHKMSTFLKGKYSELYSKEELEKYFKNRPNAQKVLSKDQSYKVEFVKELNDMFGTTIVPEEYNGELDLPPKRQHEFFNSNYE